MGYHSMFQIGNVLGRFLIRNVPAQLREILLQVDQEKRGGLVTRQRIRHRTGLLLRWPFAAPLLQYAIKMALQFAEQNGAPRRRRFVAMELEGSATHGLRVK